MSYIALIVGTSIVNELRKKNEFRCVCTFHHFLINLGCKIDINQIYDAKYIGNYNGVPVICTRFVDDDAIFVIDKDMQIKRVEELLENQDGNN